MSDGKMSSKEFMDNCTASGGNWTSMLVSGIRCLKDKDERFAKAWDKLPDGEILIIDVMRATEDCVDWSDS